MYNLGIQSQVPNIPYNPYDFQQRFQSQQQNSLIRVTGLEGAKVYQMQPNSAVALFDDSEDFFYVKSTDGAGFPTIRTFRFEEITNEHKPVAEPTEFASKEELETFKKEIVTYVKQFIQKSNATTTPAKQVESTNESSNTTSAG